MEQDLNTLILSALDITGADLRTYSPLALAFLGDSVYELIVRTVVVGRGNVSPAKLNDMSARLCSAKFQAKMAGVLMDEFTDEEADVFRRGRNSKPHTMAKNATKEEYLAATGLEAVVGYLYIKGEIKRIIELFKAGGVRCAPAELSEG